MEYHKKKKKDSEEEDSEAVMSWTDGGGGGDTITGVNREVGEGLAAKSLAFTDFVDMTTALLKPPTEATAGPA